MSIMRNILIIPRSQRAELAKEVVALCLVWDLIDLLHELDVDTGHMDFQSTSIKLYVKRVL